MKFIKIEKKEPGKFINRYDVYYELPDGSEKIYEMISRSKTLAKYEDLSGDSVAAVVMIMHSADGERILLNREFRMPCGTYVFSFPAGIIEPGESIEEAAKRELYEETGLHIDEIRDILADSFTAVGFSNEKNKVIVGTASGDIRNDHTELTEEIRTGWYTKAEISEMLKTETFAGRTQAYCYLWTH